MLSATPSSLPDAAGPFDGPFLARLERAREKANAAVRRERNAGGTWTGELSASALSTATAIAALALVARADAAVAPRLRELLERGVAWLIEHQNPDGGWGDTTRSFSNISTTTLVWAAFGLSESADPRAQRGVAAAERWLSRAAGSLEPARLVAAIEARYGDDRTFSIPILTMCALCGRLGPGPEGWRHVRQLPFELAALPQRWFGALQLPVVSYALPALIAIGQVRHGQRPTSNPLWRALRNRCRAATLEKLERLQPPNGGFLEATPLTSFVTMSLAALGLTDHAVVRRGLAFIEASVRPDGSWPIDTNLATWVTTLAVNALPDVDDRVVIREALLRQQYRREHPYTLAAPGGWAWTELPGGVPDADDTAGALLALHKLGHDNSDTHPAAIAGVTWLLGLQNRDGGIPTFCRGWGRLPFDRSSPDLTAHAVRAWLEWRPRMPPALQRRLERALARAAGFLGATQRGDGAWVPLWFGHQQDANDENPLYGTARVVPALVELEAAGFLPGNASRERATAWLLAHQGADGGWAGAVGANSSLEETGLAVEALACARGGTDARLGAALVRGTAWLVDAVERERWREPSPIGFYFAKLWYYERLYPLIFAAAALNRVAPSGRAAS